ncbi:formamidopyrimidine-DNA glycosylase [Aeropyrum camini]|uniref:Formamidopyrimidine-DNA glycosylase n=1 Tax=Aeropyrum camini SY1 = JCM 12091 TaxID=1198449 RepID=U3TBZ2_9CREN|nr:formamidopyrimidine-DNA glycosylase [Aeropyrum camini]BAN89560.1 formamidopyrimidine-DNA glycosylase [Aeropyrum camini SY1 = JCM 12091]
MTGWILKCSQCGREWVLPVSFRLNEIGRLYHFCPYCRENTFHTTVGREP